MFKTKSELDKHVGKLLMRARTDSDKNKEGLKIARLYFDLKEYESADFYLTNYLSEFSLDAFAWKLKAEICELTEKNWSKAIEYYSMSFKASDGSDSKLLLKICNCLNHVDKFDSMKAKDWLDKALKFFPYEKTVIDLKERLFEMAGNLSQSDLNEWEIFLSKAMNENFLNHEMHLKYFKINFKSKNYVKAFKHLIKIEFKSIFQRDFNTCSKWYEQIVDTLENFTQNENEFNQLQTNEKFLFYAILINTLINQILNLIQNDGSSLLIRCFSRLDKYYEKLEKSNFHLNDQFDNLVYNELVSQYYYLMGLLFLRHENKLTELDKTISDFDENFFSTQSTAGLFCFAKSILKSQPNASFLNQDNSFSTKQNPTLNLLLNDYLKLLHRDSCWRYSTIGNWLRFTISKNFSNDNLKFLELLKSFSHNKNLEQLFVDIVKLTPDSYLMSRNQEFFSLEAEYLENFDQLALEYADKCCLENQCFNLKYLIWYCLINTDYTSKCGELTEIPSYCKFKDTQHSGILFGVENLNICNLDSLCLMDLKIFYYSTYYQTLSYMNSKQFDQFKLKPYWLESNLSNENQADWWFYSRQRILRTNNRQNFFESPLDELNSNINTDNKKQNEMVKILELVRLKSQTIKLSTKLEVRYKINLSVCINVAKYLQFLNDCMDSLNLASKNSQIDSDRIQECFAQSLIQCNETSHSPKQRQSYLKYYLVRYWNFILKQLIKLKQVAYSTDGDMNESMWDSSVLNESTYTLNSTTQGQLSLYENYFNYYESVWPKKMTPTKLISNFENKESKEIRLLSSRTSSLESQDYKNFYDSVIQSAQLNLILIFTMPDSHGDFVHMFQNLDEAIGIYELVEHSLGDKWKNELSFYHLQICKRLGETLVLQRDILESMKSRDIETFRNENLFEKLEKIQKLIEFTKKKINIGFNKSLTGDLMIQSDRIKQSINASFEAPGEHGDHLGNVSISESIRELDRYFTEKAENTPEALKKRAELQEQKRIEEEQRQIELKEKEEQERLERERHEEEERIRKEEEARIERERREKEEKQRKEAEQKRLKEQEELEEKRKKEQEDKERKEREEKEQLKRELLIHQERIKKLEQDELLRWNKQKEEIEMEKNRLRTELSEEMNRKVKEIEAKNQQDKVDSSGKGRKITELIEILNQQKAQSFEMNKETLKEQFSFIKNQNSKINNELKQIRASIDNRQRTQGEFRQIVKSFNEICDAKIFSAQFNVFYWLFQNNPNLAQVMWHQQNIMNEITAVNQVKKIQEPPKYEVKTPVKNMNKMNETSFLSVNEFQTPEAQKDLSKLTNRSNSFLEKPIGEIKFPTNINVIDQLKKSADAYNLSQQSLEYDEDGEEDEDEDDEGEYYDGDDYDDEEDYEEEEDAYEYQITKSENQTKQDTFLSCEDFEISRLEASKTSVNELQILFDNSGNLYTYDIDKRLWVSKGKCNMEIIGDEISQKGNFKAHIICSQVEDKKIYEFDISRSTNVNDFKNSNSSVYWYETKKTVGDKSTPCGIKFESETTKNELVKVIENCQKKMENNTVLKNEGRSSNSFFCPTDLLPDETVSKFEKQVTINLDNKYNLPSVVLNITPIDTLHFLTIKQNDSIVFKHVMNSGQKYETSEKSKLHQYYFKYRIAREQIRVDKITQKQTNEPSEHEICLMFSSKPALNEFINVLNLKK